MQANKTKTKLKQMFKSIDDGKTYPNHYFIIAKSGMVKEELFY